MGEARTRLTGFSGTFHLPQRGISLRLFFPQPPFFLLLPINFIPRPKIHLSSLNFVTCERIIVKPSRLIFAPFSYFHVSFSSNYHIIRPTSCRAMLLILRIKVCGSCCSKSYLINSESRMQTTYSGSSRAESFSALLIAFKASCHSVFHLACATSGHSRANVFVASLFSSQDQWKMAERTPPPKCPRR